MYNKEQQLKINSLILSSNNLLNKYKQLKQQYIATKKSEGMANMFLESQEQVIKNQENHIGIKDDTIISLCERAKKQERIIKEKNTIIENYVELIDLKNELIDLKNKELHTFQNRSLNCCLVLLISILYLCLKIGGIF